MGSCHASVTPLFTIVGLTAAQVASRPNKHGKLPCQQRWKFCYYFDSFNSGGHHVRDEAPLGLVGPHAQDVGATVDPGGWRKKERNKRKEGENNFAGSDAYLIGTSSMAQPQAFLPFSAKFDHQF